MIQTLSILREEHGFRGYIHAKAVPGTSPELVQQLGHLADRMSVNMELPSQKSLQLLAPQKDKQRIIAPMRQIRDNIAVDKDTRALVRKQTTYMRQIRPKKKERAFVPAGQSTQMIVGASPESDFQILNLSAALYRTLSLKRVFFSAYTPVNDDKRLPGTDAVQLASIGCTRPTGCCASTASTSPRSSTRTTPSSIPTSTRRRTGPSTTWTSSPWR